MREIEVLFLEIDKQEMVSRLKCLGAKKVFDGEIFSENFDFPDMRISRSYNVLRLRRKREGKSELGELTIKARLSKIKARVTNEREFIVKDYGKARKALLSLGLRPIVAIRKRRLSYALGEAHFELDTVKGIPTYLEIESDSVGKLRGYAKLVGLPMKEAKPWSLRDVMRHYKKDDSYKDNSCEHFRVEKYI
jgi:adenylate cyclase, class 2